MPIPNSPLLWRGVGGEAKHYIKITFRNLWKYKTQSIISIIGLAVGFTCFALCSYAIRIQWDWNKNIRDVDRISLVCTETDDALRSCGYRYAAEQLEKDFPEIESGTVSYLISPDIEKLCEVSGKEGTNHWYEERFIFADHNFLDILGIRLLQGNKNEYQNQPNAILLTEETALKFFGAMDVVGRTFVDIDDFHDTRTVFTVYGVIENLPKQSQFESFAGIELNNRIIDRPSDWMMNQVFMNLVKIHPQTDLKKLNRKLEKYTMTRKDGKEIPIQLIPFRDQEKLSNQPAMTVALIFFMIGFLLLFTALVNYVSFVFGQILNRIKECGIRKVNGAIAGDLFFSFFIEALTSFLFACLLSFLLMYVLLNTIDFQKELSLEFDLDYLFQLQSQYTLIGIVLLGLICLVSTRRLITIPVVQSLQGGFVKYKKTEVRSIFLTIQLIICFLLLGASWFLYSQSKHLQKEYTLQLSEEDKNRTFSISLNGGKFEAVRDQILAELKQNPDVEIISRNGMSLLNAWQIGKGRFSWDEITEEQSEATLQHILTDANYLELINKETKEGRFFREDEPDRVVVNESFVRLFGRNPLGEQISVTIWGVTTGYTVVGILPDIVNSSFKKDEAIFPCMYLPYPDGHANLDCYVKVRKGSEEKFRKEMTESLRRFVHASTPVYIQNLSEDSQFSVHSEQMLFKLIFPFAICCLLIGLLGMYASVMINTEKRKKEVAIRKINGARVTDIVWLFCKNNLLLVLAAAVVAFPVLYFGLNMWLSNYAFRINVSMLSFILLALVMALLVLLTILGQVSRISRFNPAEMIKEN